MKQAILKRLITMVLTMVFALTAHAQRFTDNLDHGIVAVKLGSNTFVSWRRNAQEYYGTTYNLYCDGTKVAENLNVTNWTGAKSGTFTVRAVVDGEEQATDEVSFSGGSLAQYQASAWTSFGSNAGCLDLVLESVVDRDNKDVTHHYWPNDMVFADLDGDGQLEFVIKRINIWDANNTYPTDNNTEYVVWEAYDVNWATGATRRLWWIDCGPNMVSLNSTENNLLAYDWDMDGRAECMMRGADNMIFHHSDGTAEVIGSADVNTRGDFDHSSGGEYAWTKTGNEYLIYINGLTGYTYQVMDYPLKRFEDDEDPNDIDAAWHGQKQYGHISSKYFIAAPYLDGRKPSLFIGRGIYTRHKMMAFDIDAATHTLRQRWEWHSTPNGTTPGAYWYGNGNHNFVVADVDEDGRDEIVYGSMVIDDNGQGLHSTAYGHGDAMHVNDFDPYRKGLEIFTCIEDAPAWGMAYRSGLTGEVYVKFTSTGDDGRCMAGNFSNSVPGSVGRSAASNALMLTSDKYDTNYNLMFMFPVGGVQSQKMNFRIYWDGDLLSEQFDGIGSADEGREPAVFKWNETNMSSDRILNASGVTINGTKNNPCFQGDFLGDWREEFVLRASSGASFTEDGTTYTVFDLLRVYTTAIPTDYSIYTLWGDHQYRQAMGTQMQCYNLPPNASFFLGELENITVAPPPLVNSGRTEVRKGGTIGTASNGGHVMLAETGNASVKVAEGAAPAIFTDNAPCWVQGRNPSEYTGLADPTTTVYTHTLTGAPFSGSTQVVKQGGGILVLPTAEQSYSGATQVWAGTLQFDGKMTSSPLWLNRFATLSSNGGEFYTVTCEYGSEILPGGANETVGQISFNTLNLGFGSRVVFDLNDTYVGDNDQIVVEKLNVDTRTAAEWTTYGPKYLAPVFVFNTQGDLQPGRYPIGNVALVESGSIGDIVIDGIDEAYNPYLLIEDGALYVVIDEAEMAEEPVIQVIGMVNCDLTDKYPSSSASTYYLPKVGIVGGDGTATMSGTFTNREGKVTHLGSSETEVILNEDFEDATTVSPWVSKDAVDNLSLVMGDATYGSYVRFAFSDGKTNSRSAYWQFNDLGTIDNPYVIEFDASIIPGNNQQSCLTVMAGGAIPGNDLFASDINKQFIFDLTNTSGGSTTYSVNYGNGTVTIPSGTWCHYTIQVDVLNRKTSWNIVNKTSNTSVGSGVYNLDVSASTVPSGIFFRAGRYNADFKFDNLHVETLPAQLSAFTFTEPGTLRVSASVEGKATANAVFKANYPYVKADVDDYLSEDFEDATSTNPWTGHPNNTTLQLVEGDDEYGKYLSFSLSGASGQRHLYRGLNDLGINEEVYTIEFDASISFGSDRSSQIAILSGNLPTANSIAQSDYLFAIENVVGNLSSFKVNGGENPSINIPGNTWCHYAVTIDSKARIASWTITNKATKESVGSGSYQLPSGVNATATYLYFLAGRSYGGFKIDNVKVSPFAFLPVSIADELATRMPVDFVGGNAHIWRAGLTTASSWASLVLPFNLSKEEVAEVFGENTVVANFLTSAGTEMVVYFDTQSGNITANQPVLIKGVTKASPYLIQHVDVAATASPTVENSYFQFIGNYDNLGLTPFYAGDYFFTNGKLSKVAYDGVQMNLKGMRAYFHANQAAGATVSVLFDDPDGIAELDDSRSHPTTFDVYTISGIQVRRKAGSLQGLRPGLYIVNGKKIIIR